MTEDTDERMERASRIRQMREGQRESATDDEETADDAGTDTGAADTEQSAADDSAVDGATTDNLQTDSTASQEAQGGHGGTVRAEQDGSEDDAVAAAQRAAEAASQVDSGVAGNAPAGQAAGTAPTEDASATADDSAVTTSSQSADSETATTVMQGPTDIELPDQESIDAAIDDGDAESNSETGATPATGRGAAAEESAAEEDTVRVLEFTLGDEHYCLDIDHVEEIVKRDSITRVPNTPEYVEGVVDLRGQITTILDPKLLLDIDQTGSESLLVVFSPEEFEDQGAIGWVVDEVRQVAPIVKSEVSAAPVDAEYIEGVIDRDGEDEFVIWTKPEVAIKLATGERETEE